MIGNPTKPSRRRGRQLWLKLHRYLALSVGLLFVLIGLTGSINVFFLEIDEYINPALKAAKSGDSPLPLADIQRVIQTRHPNRQGEWRLDMPTHPGGLLKAWYYPTKDENAGYLAAPLVSIDPYTAAIVADREFYHGTTVGWIYKLHMTLLLGKTGWYLVGILGGALVVSLGTGIVLWWPGDWRKLRSALTVKLSAGAGRLNFDLHRSAGFYGAVWLLLLALTGTYLVYEATLTPLLGRVLTIHRHPWKDPDGLKSSAPPGTRPISPDRAVAVAVGQFPGAELKSVSLPKGPTGYFVVALRQPGEANITFPASKVWVDQYSGAVLARQDPNRFTAGETLLNLAFAIHSGEVFGLPGRWLVFVTGWLPLGLYVTGLRHWWRRRPLAERYKFNPRFHLEKQS